MTDRKILLVGLDGLRIDDAVKPGAAPCLVEFLRAGVHLPLTMEVPTISGPGWSSLLTGTTHAVHAVVDNSFAGHRLDATTDFLSRAAALGHSTFTAVSWPPIAGPAGSAPILAFREADQRAGRHRVVIRDGETYGYRYADGDVAAFARLALRDAGPDASFVYLGEVDEAGHLYGGDTAEYREAMHRVDARLGQLLAEVAARAETSDEDWLVGVTTDHGHLDEGGHGGADPVLTRSFLGLRRYRASGSHGQQELPHTPITPADVAGLLLAHLA